MKKIVASVGLVALGASGLQAAAISGITAPDAGKPWSISATLRGFYDDNINSAPDGQDLGSFKRESFGYEVNPSILLNFPWEQTTLSFGYSFSYKYYENALAGSTGHTDLSHDVSLAFEHAFSERYNIAVKDSFVIGQEPDMLRVGNTMETFQRVPGDNIRNYGTVVFNGQATRLFGYEIGYANSFFDYEDTGATRDEFGNLQPSVGGLLNRDEHVIHLDSRWQMLPQTVGVLGYQFRDMAYTSGEVIAEPLFSSPVYADVRDTMIHYVYAGVDHTFRPDLTGSLRAGAQFIDYYNDPSTSSDIAPYVLASLRWSYMPESYLEVGFTQDFNSTDQFLPNSEGQVTLGAESSVVYAVLTHRLTPKLFGSLQGSFQNSTYQGGEMDNEAEQFWMAGLNLEYRFNSNFSAHVGYSYDRLDSDITNGAPFTRTFDRNRVYIGLTARY
jgi:hypothetical protein